PVDIDAETLTEDARKLRRDYPWLRIEPVHADYTRARIPPVAGDGRRRTAFFPGSTIGNFHPEDARTFLTRLRETIDGGVIVGVDLRKDPAVLEVAYNDREGLTAAFNL